MSRTLVIAILFALLLPFLGSAARAQEEAAPTKDDLAKVTLAEAKAAIKGMSESAAVEHCTKLLQLWNDKEVAESLRKGIPSLLEKIAKSKDEAVALQGIGSLAQLPGDVSAKPLLGLLDKALGAKEPSVDLYGTILRGLKQVADTGGKTTKALIKLLRHKNHDVVAKVADCMAGYKGAKGKVRKELLEELIKQTEGVFQAAQSKDKNMERKWNIIRSKVINALNALSGQQFKDPAAARSWFNDNKKNKDLWK